MTQKAIIKKLLTEGGRLKKEDLKFFLKGENFIKIAKALIKFTEKERETKNVDVDALQTNVLRLYTHISSTTEQEQFKIQSFVKAIVTYVSEIEVRREYGLEKGAEVDKKGKFRRSGHLTDQILKYNYPKDTKGQLSIFDSLQDATKKQIETVGGVERSEIVEGIKLSPPETKVIDCLCKLLHENSQTSDAKKTDYYSGNKGLELVEFSGDKNTPAPKLAFTLYELTREYKGGETIGGKDVDNVKQILTDLDNKKFLLSYVETTKTKGGGRVERKIEDFRKLVHIVKISQTEYNKEDIELNKKEETIVVLNPIFKRQVDSKFILYPNDITLRTKIAYGNWDIPQITLRLRDYLMKEHALKHFTPDIKLDRLYYLLAEKWMRESRKKKVREYTDKALETVITLGLLESYKIEPAKTTGEPKVVFTLNKDWE